MIFLLTLIITVLVQSVFLSWPFFIPILLLFFILTKSSNVFLIAFVIGILQDILLLSPIGLTSAYLIIFLFVVSLYFRKFEIRSPYFIFISAFLGCALYLFITSSSFLIYKSLIMGGFSIIAWYLLILILNSKHKKSSPSLLK